MKKVRGFLFALCFSAFAVMSFPGFADFNRLSVPDSSEIRRSVEDDWFYESIETLRGKQAETHTNRLGQKFQVRIEETDSLFAIVVAPLTIFDIDVYTEEGVERRLVAEYPADVSGSWIFVKDIASEKNLYIRMYFAADRDVFVQFRPNGKRTLADFIVGGFYASRGVPTGIPFERLYTASFEDILALTEKTLPWSYAQISPGLYESSIKMASTIRNNLGRITFAPDACYDENGKPIYISSGLEREVADEESENNALSLSNLGFIKWIADGLSITYGGKGLYLEPLFRQTVNVNPLSSAGILSQNENLYYTLDWSRNIATACLSVFSGKNYLWENSGVDVTVNPFTSVFASDKVNVSFSYVKDSGYKIDVLKSLLYVLAVNEPSYFYIAAIRQTEPAEGTKPESFKFNQIAVIFTYFDKEGKFGCAVFENGKELSLNAFVAKYENSFVHLTRVFASDRFTPQ